MVSWGLRQDN